MKLSQQVELIAGPLCGDSVDVDLDFRPGYSFSLYYVPESEKRSTNKKKGFIISYKLESYGVAFFDKFEGRPF